MRSRINFQATYVYDVMLILQRVFETTSYNPGKNKEEVKKTKDFPGVTGNIIILPNGDAISNMTLCTYKARKIVPIVE